MPLSLSLKTLLPWTAALVVLLLAWFLPLPGPVLGKDQLVAARMPETRAAVEQARTAFIAAQNEYSEQISSNNPEPNIAIVRSEIERIRNAGGSFINEDALISLATYFESLQRYAAAGETYFDALKQYDGDLMAWSRSLGAASETLRDDTFPIVEHLKLYPPPIGITPDPPMFSASEVLTQSRSFMMHLDILMPGRPLGPVSPSLLEAFSSDLDNISASGRSIQHIESLHEQYYAFLNRYDGAVQATIAAGDTTRSPSSLALALNLLVGALALAGIGALFTTGWHRKRQEAVG
ncbi:MAG TPA: hypothetical protein VJ183_17705 [Chloroflexia bacterium]|nr:hypothetical protein [Chloroflexia bacterium]